MNLHSVLALLRNKKNFIIYHILFVHICRFPCHWKFMMTNPFTKSTIIKANKFNYILHPRFNICSWRSGPSFTFETVVGHLLSLLLLLFAGLAMNAGPLISHKTQPVVRLYPYCANIGLISKVKLLCCGTRTARVGFYLGLHRARTLRSNLEYSKEIMGTRPKIKCHKIP